MNHSSPNEIQITFWKISIRKKNWEKGLFVYGQGSLTSIERSNFIILFYTDDLSSKIIQTPNSEGFINDDEYLEFIGYDVDGAEWHSDFAFVESDSKSKIRKVKISVPNIYKITVHDFQLANNQITLSFSDSLKFPTNALSTTTTKINNIEQEHTNFRERAHICCSSGHFAFVKNDHGFSVIWHTREQKLHIYYINRLISALEFVFGNTFNLFRTIEYHDHTEKLSLFPSTKSDKQSHGYIPYDCNGFDPDGFLWRIFELTFPTYRFPSLTFFTQAQSGLQKHAEISAVLRRSTPSVPETSEPASTQSFQKFLSKSPTLPQNPNFPSARENRLPGRKEKLQELYRRTRESVFERYLSKVLTLSEPQRDRISQIVYTVVSSKHLTIEGQCLSLAVAIERLALFDEFIKYRMSETIDLIDLKNKLSMSEIDDNLIRRFIGVAASWQLPRANQVLHVLHNQLIISKSEYSAWKVLRNSGAHGNFENVGNPQKLITLQNHMVNLLNKMLFIVIGYSGNYTDYSDFERRKQYFNIST